MHYQRMRHSPLQTIGQNVVEPLASRCYSDRGLRLMERQAFCYPESETEDCLSDAARSRLNQEEVPELR